MQNNYKPCLEFTLKWEGGWADDPDDPGGQTMRGITLATFRQWKKNPKLTGDDLRNISDEDLQDIYKHGYWDRVHGDELPLGVDLMAFDMQVNSGVNSARILQAIVGVTVDGSIGPITLAAVMQEDPIRLVHDLASHQMTYYRSLGTFKKFGQGWGNRLNGRHSLALKMIEPKKTIEPDDSKQSDKPSEVKPKPHSKSKT